MCMQYIIRSDQVPTTKILVNIWNKSVSVRCTNPSNSEGKEAEHYRQRIRQE